MVTRSAEETRALAQELEQDAVRYPEDRGEILLEAAHQWIRAGEVDHAVALLGEVLALGGDDAGFARVSLADICFDRGADAEAWGHLRALEEIWSSRGPAELAGELLEERGEYEAALPWFDRAVSAVDVDALARPGAAPSLDAISVFGRQRCRAKLGLPADDLDRAADVAEDDRREFVDRLERATTAWAATSRRRAVLEMLVWQRSEQQLAAQRWPEVFTADVVGNHAGSSSGCGSCLSIRTSPRSAWSSVPWTGSPTTCTIPAVIRPRSRCAWPTLGRPVTRDG